MNSGFEDAKRNNSPRNSKKSGLEGLPKRPKSCAKVS
jgi:hypothetical protein